MGTQTLDPARIDTIIREWQATLQELVQEVSGWVADLPGWTVLPQAIKEISEEGLPSYPAPVLTLDTPSGRLILEPMARMVFGGKGTVELYAYPTLYRVRLIRDPKNGTWTILTDSRVKIRQPWDKETFLMLAEDLLGDT